MKKTSGKVISGADVFKLYDTYGLNYDLIEYVASSAATLDQEGFDAELEKQRQRARESMKGGVAKIVNPVYQKIAQLGQTEFTGYAGTELSGSKVMALVEDGELVDEIAAGDEAEVVLDRTPFYAESGGQVGDVGVLENEDARLLVTDAYSPTSVDRSPRHGRTGRIESRRHDQRARRRRKARARWPTTRRRTCCTPRCAKSWGRMSNRPARWSPDRLRFDFTHFALAQEEIAEIERLVNDQTLRTRRSRKRKDSGRSSGGRRDGALRREIYRPRARGQRVRIFD